MSRRNQSPSDGVLHLQLMGAQVLPRKLLRKSKPRPMPIRQLIKEHPRRTPATSDAIETPTSNGCLRTARRYLWTLYEVRKWRFSLVALTSSTCPSSRRPDRARRHGWPPRFGLVPASRLLELVPIVRSRPFQRAGRAPRTVSTRQCTPEPGGHAHDRLTHHDHQRQHCL